MEITEEKEQVQNTEKGTGAIEQGETSGQASASGADADAKLSGEAEAGDDKKQASASETDTEAKPSGDGEAGADGGKEGTSAGGADTGAKPSDAKACRPEPDKFDARQETGGAEWRDEILGAIGELSRKSDELNKLFTEKIRYNDHEGRIADEMHKELQKHRQGMYSLMTRPLIMDIIDMRESILKNAAKWAGEPENERDFSSFIKLFSSYAEDAGTILENNGIEIYRSAAGDAFSPARHKVAKKVATGDLPLDKKIADSLSCGYVMDGKPLFAERVAVYAYEKTDDKTKPGE
jgi:molecular chaperone GrpE (heat shock protein)